MRRERSEFVGMRSEWLAGEFGNLLGGAFAEFGMSIQSRTDRGAPDGECPQSREHLLQAFQIRVEQRDVAGEFLTQRDRRSVLQVGAANLYDGIELLALGI